MAEIPRDEKGHFISGHGSPNPGGSTRDRIAYRQALEEAVTLEDFKAVVGILKEAAKASKPWAVKTFFDLTVGRDYHLTAEQTENQRLHEMIFKFETIANKKEEEERKRLEREGVGATT